jgi:hypothetical protein
MKNLLKRKNGNREKRERKGEKLYGLASLFIQ